MFRLGIACPLPECIHCNLSDTSAVLDGVLDVECHDGYIIDGEARITCQDDQTFNAKPACKGMPQHTRWYYILLVKVCPNILTGSTAHL